MSYGNEFINSGVDSDVEDYTNKDMVSEQEGEGQEDFSNESAKESNEQVQAYVKILKNYCSLYRRVKELLYRIDKSRDEVKKAELRETLVDLDVERNRAHNKLKESGEKIKKNEYDVLVDILRENATLEEYGLPEFAILTARDTVYTSRSIDQDQFEWNLDDSNNLSGAGSRSYLGLNIKNGQPGAPNYYRLDVPIEKLQKVIEEEGGEIDIKLKENEALIVFNDERGYLLNQTIEIGNSELEFRKSLS